MKKYLLIVLLLVASASYSATLSDLKHKLRVRTSELTDSTSFFTDTMATIWLNMAQERIVRLGGYIPKYTDINYSWDSNTYNLPSGFIRATSGNIKTRGQWFPAYMVNNIVDSPYIQMKVVWKDEDSAQVILMRAGFEERQHDIIYNQDSLSYVLPRDFRSPVMVMIRKNGNWEPAYQNTAFQLDTNIYNYTVLWKSTDTALLYIKPSDLYDGDTLRVFYRRSLQNDDTLRVNYVGTAPAMTLDTSTCQVPFDLQGFIVEEAYSYYIMSQKRFQEAILLQRNIRQDMGITVQQ